MCVRAILRSSHYSSSRRCSKIEDGFSGKRCITWFREYTTSDDPDTLGKLFHLFLLVDLSNLDIDECTGPDGMEKFCEDIGVEPENVVMLVLAYKMGARRMGFFTQSEWTKGLTDLQCDTPSKVQSKMDHLRNCMNDFSTFKGVYRYAYDFARV